MQFEDDEVLDPMSPEEQKFGYQPGKGSFVMEQPFKKVVPMSINDIDEVQSAKLDEALERQISGSGFILTDPDNKDKDDHEFELPLTEDFDLDKNLLLDEKLDDGMDDLDDDELLI